MKSFNQIHHNKSVNEFPPWLCLSIRFQPETIERLLNLCWWDWNAAQIAANLELLYTNPDEWPSELLLKEPDENGLRLIGMSAGIQADGADNTKA
ncbi:MAG: hypothetical protein AAGA83_08660 [Cyanobacteria bacterium P01_F01_bin.116]